MHSRLQIDALKADTSAAEKNTSELEKQKLTLEFDVTMAEAQMLIVAETVKNLNCSKNGVGEAVSLAADPTRYSELKAEFEEQKKNFELAKRELRMAMQLAGVSVEHRSSVVVSSSFVKAF